jgi:hypothetical protein
MPGICRKSCDFSVKSPARSPSTVFDARQHRAQLHLIIRLLGVGIPLCSKARVRGCRARDVLLHYRRLSRLTVTR